MIIVRLQGGLGNQMFQYAMGRALALRMGTELRFDRSWYERRPDHAVQRPLALDVFQVQMEFVREGVMPADWGNSRGHYGALRNFLIRHFPSLRSMFHWPDLFFLVDRGRGFQDEMLSLGRGDDYYCAGYWQSEKYFMDARSVLRQEFSFRASPDSSNHLMLERISADAARGAVPVSVHVRRGDYSSDPQTMAVHGVLSLDHYHKAAALMESRFDRVSYYVFSDDLAWCRKNLRFRSLATLVDINEGASGWMDMRLMSACHHHIIANSSFSWWGAWLNARADKVVIAPRKWFLDQKHNHQDVLPTGCLVV